MRILCAFHDIQDPGGITNHQEHLTRALQALGHTVEARLLVWRADLGSARSAPSRGLAQEVGALGMQLDQKAGWFWPPEKRVPYKGAANMARWKTFAAGFDLVIWQIPTVTERRDQYGNADWPELYNMPVKQLAVIHDGNLADGYPWIYAVAKHLTGLVGVHPCGYKSALKVPLPCALIPNPHADIGNRVSLANQFTGDDRDGWMSVQTFKGWKHVPDLIRAVPHMQMPGRRVLAGGGIEYYYMTSQDKMKPIYTASRKLDPDLPAELEGNRIWDNALASNMVYTGFMTNAERDAQLQRAKFLIDPSWNLKYAKTGDHFNRTPIEGIIAGCVPIARDMGIADNTQGVGYLFKPGVNYVMIPYNATPKEFAGIVDAALAMPETQRLDMLAEGRKLLKHFDALHVAQSYIDFAEGKNTGLECGRGVDTPEVRVKSDIAMVNFFGQQGETV